jgi:hypothetical protein
VELELRLRLGLRLGWDERDVGEWFVVNVAGCFGVVEILFLFLAGKLRAEEKADKIGTGFSTAAPANACTVHILQ